MVTLIKYGALSGSEKYNANVLNIDGLSTDTKPIRIYIEYGSDGREVGRTGITNGSLYTEIDTGDTYMYDTDNTIWHKVSIGGGSAKPEGGIILVGETTTALTEGATTNPIVVDGQSYTAQPNDAVLYGNKEFLFTGTRWREFGDLSGLSSKDIGAMTGYAKTATGSAIASTDTLNQAIGKVEKRVDVNESNILSLEANIYGGTVTYQGEYIEDYYVNNVQRRLVSLVGFNTSELIELKKGDTISVSGAKSSTAGVVDLLSSWTSKGTYLNSITAYSTTSTESAEYTATSEIEYVRVCSMPIPTVTINVEGITENIETIASILNGTIEDVDVIKNATVTYETIEPELEVVNGKYINFRGTINSLNIYAYTKNLEINRGDTVSITSQDPSGDAVSRISLWTSDGTYIRTVDYGTTAVTTGTYTATEDTEYVRFSYCKQYAVKIEKTSITIPEAFEDAVNSIIDERIDPNTNINYSISMFESVAFCGDSYVKGQIYNSQGLVGDRPNLAWGSCMGRLFGVDAHIYASSGADTHTWQERSSCLPLALSENARGLYIFCMGINDSSYVTTGTIEDITNYESYEDYPNTFYGNYGKIIEQIQAHAPNSKIIIMTPYHPNYNERYVTPIQEITEHYGIAMINTRNSELCMDASFSSLLVGGHPTAPLHSAMANDIEKLIRKCISANYSYFKDYAGV